MSIRNGLLALLEDGPRHGYELRKDLETNTGALWELNIGQIYTTLGRLERDGCVEEVIGTHSDRRPDDAADNRGSDNSDDSASADRGPGADQRRYAITDEGRRELEQWFTEPRRRSAPGRDELVIKITLADHSSSVAFDEVINAQVAASTEELQTYTALLARTEEGDIARSMALDGVIAQIDGELRWLEKCRSRHHEGTGRRRNTKTQDTRAQTGATRKASGNRRTNSRRTNRGGR